MNYEKKYKEALERARKLYEQGTITESLCYVFPELKESENERIREWIINDIRYNMDNEPLNNSEYKKNAEKAIAWLEKQESVGEIVSRCKTSWYNEGKIQGQIEGLSDEEKYQQGWHDALEKQGEQKHTDKIEPKFNVGDTIKITGINNGHTGFSILNTEDRYYYNWKLVENKPTWNEEDEKTWKELIEEVKDQLDSVPSPDCRDKEDEKVLKQLTRWIVWLESLKYRVQPKQE